MKTRMMQTFVGSIHCYQWLPEGEPVGVVQIIHGVRDYMARYEDLACFLANNGYVVVGEDHPGHGRSVTDGDRYGYLTGGWSGTLKVIHQLFTETRREYCKIPYFMLGHSMGSFLLRTYLYTYHTDLSGAIFSGTGWMPDAVLPAGEAFCRQQAAKYGEDGYSPMVQKLMLDGFNRTLEPARTPYDWVCGRESVVDAYASDPFCTWQPTIQLCREMLCGVRANQKRSNLARMQKELPVFFFAGQQDPVGNMGNGVLKTVQAFKNAGMQDVLVELYPNMRHECHNEADREKVFRDILNWIREKTT